MIAAYQRISRADGDLGKDGKDKSNSIENQKELILRYISCKESLQNVPVMDFVDDGYTGSNFDRPGFQQMMDDLQWVPVKKDDLFFIEAGTIHAIGAGALVAEIQENSNLTYRLYDYDRVGKDGKKRELHIDKALDVANLKGSAEPKQPLRVLKYRQGIASELLTRCKYFEVYRMIVNTERRQKVHYRADEIAFRVLLCVNGCGTISYEGGNLPFYKGDCIFVPADSETLTIHGQAQFLDVRG